MTTPFERLYEREKRATATPDTEDAVDVETHHLNAKSTTIDGERVDTEDPVSPITFVDEAGHLSGEYGRPRPRKFWHAAQIGQTPPMELIKNVVKRQLIGGQPIAEAEEELQGPVADFADILIDIYEGPHFQQKTLDHLLADALSDMLDTGWAYWEILPSADGEYPVAGFKPLPPLQVQHNTDDSGDFVDDPAIYVVPHKRGGGQITIDTSDPATLSSDQFVTMRWPLATESDLLYGESLATKVREYIELLIDVDTHQKRHYADSELPAGFLHFTGNIGEDKLDGIRQDIIEAAGDPHELVTTTSEDNASWIPVGDSVVDLDAIAEQQWYFKLVLAAVGLNSNELGIVEGAGFAKETPALQKAVYKNVTKPALNAVWQPQNTQVVPQAVEPLPIDEVPFRLTLERFDPVQEQIEKEERMDEWNAGELSLNELRGGNGRGATEFLVELAGQEVDLADTPKYLVEKLVSIESPDPLGGANGNGGEASATDQGGPLGQDPVLSLSEVSDRFGVDAHEVARRLQANRKQLDATIEVSSSFLVSTAYDERADPPFMQLEFERENEPNWIYWYASVPKTGAASFFGFLRADSKGRYFNSKIRHTGDPGYQYARVQ